MKKLIAILLVFACMFAMASCSLGEGSGNDPASPGSSAAATQKILDVLADQIRKSKPTKSVVTTVTGNNDVNLTSTETVVIGEVSGKEASLYEYEKEQFVDLGTSTTAKEVTKETREYVEGSGLRVNGGKWEKKSNPYQNIIPYRMNLNASMIQGFHVKEDKLSYEFAIPQKNIATVLAGLDVSSIITDVSVLIETDGAAVTRIRLSYDMRNIALGANTQFENSKVVIDARYSYDLQSITLIDKK